MDEDRLLVDEFIENISAKAEFDIVSCDKLCQRLAEKVELLHSPYFTSRLTEIVILVSKLLPTDIPIHLKESICSVLFLVPKKNLEISEIAEFIVALCNCLSIKKEANNLNENIFLFLFPVLPVYSSLLSISQKEKVTMKLLRRILMLLNKFYSIEVEKSENDSDSFNQAGAVIEGLSILTIIHKVSNNTPDLYKNLNEVLGLCFACLQYSAETPSLENLKILTKIVFVCLIFHRKKDYSDIVSNHAKGISETLVYILRNLSTKYLKERIEALSLFRTMLSSDLRSSIFFHCDELHSTDIIFKFKGSFQSPTDTTSFCEHSRRFSKSYPSDYSSIAFMTLADFYHHARAIIPAKKLHKVMQLFLRTFNSFQMPMTLQNISVRVIRSMVDTIYNATVRGEQIDFDFRALISSVLKSLMEKVKFLNKIKQEMIDQQTVDEKYKTNGTNPSVTEGLKDSLCNDFMFSKKNTLSHFVALFETILTVVKSSLWCISNFPTAVIRGTYDQAVHNVSEDLSGLLRIEELSEFPTFLEAALEILVIYDADKSGNGKNRRQNAIALICSVLTELMPPDFLEVGYIKFEAIFHIFVDNQSIFGLIENIFKLEKLRKFWLMILLDFVCQHLPAFASNLLADDSGIHEFDKFPSELYIKRVKVTKTLSTKKEIEALSWIFQIAIKSFSLLDSKGSAKDYVYVVPSTVMVALSGEGSQKASNEPIRQLFKEDKSNWGASRVIRKHIEHIILYCLIFAPHLVGSVMSNVSIDKKDMKVEVPVNTCIYLQMFNFILSHLVRRSSTKKYCDPFLGSLGMPILQGLTRLLNSYDNEKMLEYQPYGYIEQEVICESILYISLVMSKNDIRLNLSLVENAIKISLLSYHKGNVDLSSLAIRLLDIWVGSMDRALLCEQLIFSQKAVELEKPTVGRILLSLLVPTYSDVPARALRLVGQLGGRLRLETLTCIPRMVSHLPVDCRQGYTFVLKICEELGLLNAKLLDGVLDDIQKYAIFNVDDGSPVPLQNKTDFFKTIELLFSRLVSVEVMSSRNVLDYKLLAYFLTKCLSLLIIFSADDSFTKRSNQKLNVYMTLAEKFFLDNKFQKIGIALFKFLHNAVIQVMQIPRPRTSQTSILFLTHYYGFLSKFVSLPDEKYEIFRKHLANARFELEEKCRQNHWNSILAGLLGLQVFIENIKFLKNRQEKQEALTSLTKTLVLSLKNYLKDHGRNVLVQLENCLGKLVTVTVKERLDVTPMVEQLSVCLMASLKRCRVVAVACLNKIACLLGITLNILLGRATRAMKYLREYIIARSFKIMTPKKQISFLALISTLFAVEPSPLTLTSALTPGTTRNSDNEAYVRSINYNLYKRLAQTLYEALSLSLNDNVANESLSLAFAYPEVRISATDSEDLLHQRSPATLFLSSYAFKERPHEIELRLALHVTIKSLLSFPRLSQIYQVCLEREGFYVDLIGKVLEVLFSSVSSCWTEVRQGAIHLLRTLPIFKIAEKDGKVSSTLNSKYMISNTQLECALAIQLSRLEKLDVLSYHQVRGVTVILGIFSSFCDTSILSSTANRLVSHLRWFGTVEKSQHRHQAVSSGIDIAWLESNDPAAKRFDSTFCSRIYDAHLFGELVKLFCFVATGPSVYRLALGLANSFLEYPRKALTSFNYNLLMTRVGMGLTSPTNYTSSVLVQATQSALTSPIIGLLQEAFVIKHEDSLYQTLIGFPEVSLASDYLILEMLENSVKLRSAFARRTDILMELFLLIDDTVSLTKTSLNWMVFGIKILNLLLPHGHYNVEQGIIRLTSIMKSETYQSLVHTEWKFVISSFDFCLGCVSILCTMIAENCDKIVSVEVLKDSLLEILHFYSYERVSMSSELYFLLDKIVISLSGRFEVISQICLMSGEYAKISHSYLLARVLKLCSEGRWPDDALLSLVNVVRKMPKGSMKSTRYLQQQKVLEFASLHLGNIKLDDQPDNLLSAAFQSVAVISKVLSVTKENIFEIWKDVFKTNNWWICEQKTRFLCLEYLAKKITEFDVNLLAHEELSVHFVRTFLKESVKKVDCASNYWKVYYHSYKAISLMDLQEFELLLPSLHNVVFGSHSSVETATLAISFLKSMLLKIVRGPMGELLYHRTLLVKVEVFLGKLCCHLLQNTTFPERMVAKALNCYNTAIEFRERVIGYNKIEVRGEANSFCYLNRKVQNIEPIESKKMSTEESVFVFSVLQLINMLLERNAAYLETNLNIFESLPRACTLALYAEQDEGLEHVVNLVKMMGRTSSFDSMLKRIVEDVVSILIQELYYLLTDISIVHTSKRHLLLIELVSYCWDFSYSKYTLSFSGYSLEKELQQSVIELFFATCESMKKTRKKFVECFKTKDEINILVSIRCRCRMSVDAQKFLNESRTLFDFLLKCVEIIEFVVLKTNLFLETYINMLTYALKRDLHVEISKTTLLLKKLFKTVQQFSRIREETLLKVVDAVKEWIPVFNLHGLESIESSCLELTQSMLNTSLVTESFKKAIAPLVLQGQYSRLPKYRNTFRAIRFSKFDDKSILAHVNGSSILTFQKVCKGYECLNNIEFSSGMGCIIAKLRIARLHYSRDNKMMVPQGYQLESTRKVFKHSLLQLGAVKDTFMQQSFFGNLGEELQLRSKARRIYLDATVRYFVAEPQIKKTEIDSACLQQCITGTIFETFEEVHKAQMKDLDPYDDYLIGYWRQRYPHYVSQASLALRTRGLVQVEADMLATALNRFSLTGNYALALDNTKCLLSIRRSSDTIPRKVLNVADMERESTPAFDDVDTLRGQFEANVAESLLYSNEVVQQNVNHDDLFDADGFFELFEGNDIPLDNPSPVKSQPAAPDPVVQNETVSSYDWRLLNVSEEEIAHWNDKFSTALDKLAIWDNEPVVDSTKESNASFDKWLKVIRSGNEVRRTELSSARSISLEIVEKFATCNDVTNNIYTELLGVEHLSNLQRLSETDDTLNILNSLKVSARKLSESNKKNKVKLDISQVWRRLAAWRLTIPHKLEGVRAWNSILENRLLLFRLMTGTLSQVESNDYSFMAQDILFTKTVLATYMVNQNMPHKAYASLIDVEKDLSDRGSKITADDFVSSQIELSNAVLKVNDLQKAFAGSPLQFEAILASLSSVQALNIDNVQKRKLISDVFRARARLFAEIRNTEESISSVENLFSRSVQSFEQNTATWLDWHDFMYDVMQTNALDHTHQETVKGFHPKAALTMTGAILQAVCLGSPKARLLLPEVFWQMHIESELVRGEEVLKSFPSNQISNEESVFNTVIQFIQIIPTWIWLPYVPQLLTGVTKAEKLSSYHILHNLLYKYPQALYSALRVKLLEIRDKGVEDTKDGVPPLDVKTTEVYNNIRQLYNKLHKEHPRVTNETQLWLEEFTNNCKLLLPMQEFENAVCKLYNRCLKIATGVDESIVKMTKIACGSRLLFVWYILKKLCSQLKPSSTSSDSVMNDLKVKFLSDFNPPEARFNFLRKSDCSLNAELEALKQPELAPNEKDFSILAILRRLWGWKHALQFNWRDNFEDMFLRNISFKLRNISFNVLSVPGQYASELQLSERNFKILPLLAFIDPKVEIVCQQEVPQIKVGFHGVDGLTRHFLVQTLSRCFSTLRPDFRSKHFHETLFALMKESTECVRRCLVLKTPVFVSVNTKMRLQSIPKGHSSVEKLFLDNCKDPRTFPNDLASGLSYNVALNKEMRVTAMRSIFQEVEDYYYEKYLVEASTSDIELFKNKRRLAYFAGTTAAMDLLFGCADRKANQSLLMLGEGVSVVEYGLHFKYSSKSNGKLLFDNEAWGSAPFHLGLNIMKTLGNLGVYGPMFNATSLILWYLGKKENRAILSNISALTVRDDLVEAAMMEDPSSRHLEGLKKQQRSIDLHHITLQNLQTVEATLDKFSPNASQKHNIANDFTFRQSVPSVDSLSSITDPSALKELNASELPFEQLNLDDAVLEAYSQSTDISKIVKHDAAWMAWM